MTYVDELSCEIYVDTDVPRSDLAELIARHLDSATTQLGDIETTYYHILIYENIGFDEERRRDADDGFLSYRYYLDVEALPMQKREDQIKMVSDLLEYLWSQRWPAVAVCEYEDQLPNRGGYGRSSESSS